MDMIEFDELLTAASTASKSGKESVDTDVQIY